MNDRGSVKGLLIIALLAASGSIFYLKWPYVKATIARWQMDPDTRGVLDMQKMRFDDAQKSFEAAAAEEPRKADAHYLLGWSLQSQGKDAEALEAYRRAEGLAPQDQTIMGKIHSNRGAILVKRGDFQSAATSYRQAVRMNPRSTDDRFQLGMAYLSLGQKPQALEMFQSVRSLDPTHAAAAFQIQRLESQPKAPAVRKLASVKKPAVNKKQPKGKKAAAVRR